mmetsp:Transcript_70797/g.160143  ORF Transcript_70797/g.160143 Transcript_70797/m.160143 type:complete len:207 (-) Transcript_70797:101-721(-)
MRARRRKAGRQRWRGTGWRRPRATRRRWRISPRRFSRVRLLGSPPPRGAERGAAGPRGPPCESPQRRPRPPRRRRLRKRRRRRWRGCRPRRSWAMRRRRTGSAVSTTPVWLTQASRASKPACTRPGPGTPAPRSRGLAPHWRLWKSSAPGEAKLALAPPGEAKQQTEAEARESHAKHAGRSTNKDVPLCPTCPDMEHLSHTTPLAL